MDHIVKQIVECNAITEKLVRITYLKTKYTFPSKSELDDDTYDEEEHHHYNTEKYICILSVFGDKNAMKMRHQINMNMKLGKIHIHELNYINHFITVEGICTDNYYTAVYEEDHYQMTILSVENLN